MKTKNIFKIAIFSITLLALLISPVIKSNILRVNADDPDSDSSQSAANQTISDIYMLGYGISTEDITTGLLEERADDICKINANDWIDRCMADGTIKFVCQMQGFFVKQWCFIVKGVLEGFGKMFAGIINSEIEWILNALNPKTYGGLATNKGVVAIWTVLRNIVNSLLVLGLIGIAIATILGYKKYAWKQVLWKLILVALLVNFSLVISGIVVDTSNYLTGYFLTMSQENGSIAPRIMEGYGYKASSTPDTYDPPIIFSTDTSGKNKDKYNIPEIMGAEDAKETASYNLRFGNFFIISFVMILVGGFAIIALLAIFLTVVARNLFLIMLLGLSPIAFAAWIFPDTEKYWKMWWSNFIKWCFFPVIFAFILFLALTVMDAMPAIATTDSIAVTIVRMILFSMFLVGGLILSIQGGGVVSKTVLQQSSKIGAAAGAFLTYKALKGATSSETWRKAQKKLEGSKFAPTHDIGVWMGRQPGKIRSAELKQIEEDYKGRSPDQIRVDMGLHKADRKRVALGLNALIEKGSLDYEKDNKFIEVAKDQPNLNVSGIKKIHPELYTEYFTSQEDMKNAIEKIERKYPGITKDQAKNRVITDLMAEQVTKSSSDNIKSGNWVNIFDRLEKKKETDQFFGTLLDKRLPAEKLAAMINSIDDTKKQIEFTDRFMKSAQKHIGGNYNDVINDLKSRGYDKNKVLKATLGL